jgi:hypothetical protein
MDKLKSFDQAAAPTPLFPKKAKPVFNHFNNMDCHPNPHARRNKLLSPRMFKKSPQARELFLVVFGVCVCCFCYFASLHASPLLS